MSRSILATSLFLVLSLGLAAAADKGKGKGKNKGHDDERGHENHAAVTVDVFIGGDREIIHDYVTSYQGGGLPPGLAKRGGDLPPGLQKQLRKKGKLPPGLEKKLVAFPVELEGRLSPLRPGLRRAFIEGRAVIYNEATSVILDVFVPL